MKYLARNGFTLIELLIVIALLGALAVGLLATIDPFEQLKKGRDTSLRNTVSEFYNANLRYYATKANFPWNSTATVGTPITFTASNLNDTNMSGAISELVSVGELKARFSQLAGSGNLAKIFVTSSATDQVSVCYKPESKAFQEDANTQYESSGVTSDGQCKSQVSGTGGTSCMWCVQ